MDHLYWMDSFVWTQVVRAELIYFLSFGSFHMRWLSGYYYKLYKEDFYKELGQ